LLLLLLLFTALVCWTCERMITVRDCAFPVTRVDRRRRRRGVKRSVWRGIGDTFMAPIYTTIHGCGVRTRVCVTIIPKGCGGTLLIQKVRAIRVYINLYYVYNSLNVYTRPSFKHCVINNACAEVINFIIRLRHPNYSSNF